MHLLKELVYCVNCHEVCLETASKGDIFTTVPAWGCNSGLRFKMDLQPVIKNSRFPNSKASIGPLRVNRLYLGHRLSQYLYTVVIAYPPHYRTLRVYRPHSRSAETLLKVYRPHRGLRRPYWKSTGLTGVCGDPTESLQASQGSAETLLKVYRPHRGL